MVANKIKMSLFLGPESSVPWLPQLGVPPSYPPVLMYAAGHSTALPLPLLALCGVSSCAREYLSACCSCCSMSNPPAILIPEADEATLRLISEILSKGQSRLLGAAEGELVWKTLEVLELLKIKINLVKVWVPKANKHDPVKDVNFNDLKKSREDGKYVVKGRTVRDEVFNSTEELEEEENVEKGFRGFREKNIPDWVYNSYRNIDLNTPFKVKPSYKMFLKFREAEAKESSITNNYTLQLSTPRSKWHLSDESINHENVNSHGTVSSEEMESQSCYETTSSPNVQKNDLYDSFICPYCEKKYRYKQRLQTHIEREHLMGSFKCEQCGVYFSKHGLSIHMKKDHP